MDHNRSWILRFFDFLGETAVVYATPLASFTQNLGTTNIDPGIGLFKICSELIRASDERKMC